MQDIHSLGSRIFSGGIDRRLRTHNTMNHQQALKCPRCESLNTKFCYFNNYNLSQPRHFCKGCRRYWTKGGVLRNVPVGGGFRKAKRSSKSKQPPSSADADVPPPRKSDSNSSSESSSLTATTTTTTTTAATEVVSGGSSSNSCPTLFNFAPDSQVFVPQITNPSFSQPDLIDPSSNGTGSIFHEIGRFTEMMTSSTDLGFIIADMSTFGSENQSNDKVVENEGLNQVQDMTSGGYLDQTVEIEFAETENRISNGGLAGVDWRNGVDDQDQGMFDLTGTVDEAYWSQTQWPDHTDHSSFLYLP